MGHQDRLGDMQADGVDDFQHQAGSVAVRNPQEIQFEIHVGENDLLVSLQDAGDAGLRMADIAWLAQFQSRNQHHEIAKALALFVPGRRELP